jgi:hypothetical protein
MRDSYCETIPRRHSTELDRLATVALAVLTIAAVLLPGPRAVVAQPEAGREDLTSSGAWKDYDSNPLRVNVGQDRGDRAVYRPGEPVNVTFGTNRDAYAVVYRIDSDGEVTILWPRSRLDDGFVFGEQDYELPMGSSRLLASAETGQEYVEAVASLYPFDLRDLEVDFLSDGDETAYHYQVTGDPFLAMNEVNYAITGMEDSEDYVVTNYTSYDVGRQVDHPRYLCSQCHDADAGPDPYDAACVLAIHHDYGWSNQWFVRFGYYPVYSYPAYYYVDPWTWEPWVNYWYTPWYGWPQVAVYDWPFSCHLWHHSPFWHEDSWTRWRSGDHRYLPLDKRYLTRDSERSRFLDRRSALVKAPEPTSDTRRVLETRYRDFERDAKGLHDGRGVAGAPSVMPAVYRDVGPERRVAVKSRSADKPAVSRPGLRINESGRTVDRRTLGSPATSRVQRPANDGRTSTYRRDANRGSTLERSRNSRGPEEGRTIRTVEPRRPGTRIWSGGRANPNPDREVRPGSVPERSRERETPQVKERSGSSPRGSEARPAPPSRDNSRGSGRSSGERSGGGRSASAEKRR